MLHLQALFGKPGRLGFGAFAALVIVTQPYRPLVFVGESMSPTYHDREIAITVPTEGPLRRGDIVVAMVNDERIVKRVAYVEGDLIPQLRTGSEWVDAVYIKRADAILRKAPHLYREVAVPTGHVYLLGDNSSASQDSRDFGYVAVSQVERRVLQPRARKRSRSVSERP